MIDADGFRPNVGIILANGHGEVLWAKRHGQDAWQFPQGGINRGEAPEQALYRELYEETGLQAEDVKLLASTPGWLRYRLPERMQRKGQKPLCIGQKQRWFLLEMLSDDAKVRFDCGDKAEFDAWQWVSYWYPLDQVIDFKRDVYRQAMKFLCKPHNQLVRQQGQR